MLTIWGYLYMPYSHFFCPGRTWHVNHRYARCCFHEMYTVSKKRGYLGRQFIYIFLSSHQIHFCGTPDHGNNWIGIMFSHAKWIFYFRVRNQSNRCDACVCLFELCWPHHNSNQVNMWTKTALSVVVSMQ